MRQKNKSYSVIIVSDALSTNKEFVISKKFIRYSVVAVSLLVLVFGFVIFDYLTKYVNISMDNKENEMLKKERKENLKKIQYLTSNIRDYKQRFAQMEEFKKKIMIVSGLNSPYSLKEVGIGGASPSPLDQGNQGQMTTQTPTINTENLNTKNDLINTDSIHNNSLKTQRDLKFLLKVINDKKVQIAATPAIWPCRGYISSGFGYRSHPFTGKREFHNGLDISANLGYDIKATGDGIVVVAEVQGYMGKTIIIDHGFGYTTRYGHLSDYNVKENQKVKRGQVIGYVGNTGRSSAPHLHYEVRHHEKPMNPMDYIFD